MEYMIHFRSCSHYYKSLIKEHTMILRPSIEDPMPSYLLH